MSERAGTGSKSTGLRVDKASTQSKRPNHNTLGIVRNRNISEDVTTVSHRDEDIRQILDSILATYVVGDRAQKIKMYGGYGGDGGNGVNFGIGGNGGIGEGPRILIDTFSGIQIILDSSKANRQIIQKLDDILRLLGVASDVPHGFSDDLFWVMDPAGGYIPVSLWYCHDYARAGGSYVERGEYRVVSKDGNFIVPGKFAQTVKAGMLLEISILKRQIRNRSDTIQNTTCPSCSSSRVTSTDNGWFKCTTCERNYRMDRQDHDSEEILGPQIAYVAFVG
ncbi:hypothetical protein B0H19DRAFT_1341854 [Mycena capillaripes]|nr:hypothetical protein B0H19DRAFT_1341854 [Mycena capillaripes]